MGRIGDGSGESGFYVVPKTVGEAQMDTKPFGRTQTYAEMGASVDRSNPAQMQQATQTLNQFIGNCNPVDRAVFTLDRSRVERMQKESRSSTPRTGSQAKRSEKEK